MEFVPTTKSQTDGCDFPVVPKYFHVMFVMMKRWTIIANGQKQSFVGFAQRNRVQNVTRVFIVERKCQQVLLENFGTLARGVETK